MTFFEYLTPTSEYFRQPEDNDTQHKYNEENAHTYSGLKYVAYYLATAQGKHQSNY